MTENPKERKAHWTFYDYDQRKWQKMRKSTEHIELLMIRTKKMGKKTPKEHKAHWTSHDKNEENDTIRKGAKNFELFIYRYLHLRIFW